MRGDLGRHLETLDVLADVVDVNATNEYGIAPLPSAVHMGDEAVLARLLRSKVCICFVSFCRINAEGVTMQGMHRMI